MPYKSIPDCGSNDPTLGPAISMRVFDTGHAGVQLKS